MPASAPAIPADGRSITENRLADPDSAYRALIDAHRGLTDEESATLNTRLVLILANQLGDVGLLKQAIGLAKGDWRS